jgi:hypothetical protein
MQRGDLDRALEALVLDSRDRMSSPLEGRDRWASLASSAGLLAAASAAAALLPWHRSVSGLEAVALIVVLACLSRVQFEIGSGVALPTELALVPMLFVLPAAMVPLCATAGYLLGALVDVARRRAHPDRLFVVIAYSWHTLAPALVLSLAGDRPPRWSDWPLYLVALGAQLGLDAATVVARDVLVLGVPARGLAPFVGWAYTVDCALAPVGLLAAFGSTASPFAFVLVLPVGGLLALLAQLLLGLLELLLLALDRIVTLLCPRGQAGQRDRQCGQGREPLHRPGPRASQPPIAPSTAPVMDSRARLSGGRNSRADRPTVTSSTGST